MTHHLYAEAQQWLHQALGKNATFREGQWEAIELVVAQRKRALVVQKTGWGKSLVYFLATRLLRNQGHGVTILISPLLSLMRNQLQAADRLGLRAVTLNSTNQHEWEKIEGDLLQNQIDILFISPERLGNEGFQERIWDYLKNDVGLFVVDEVHCISDWGHDFRPNYRRIMGILNDLPPDTPVIGTTATANDRVVEDVAEIMGQNIAIMRGALTRESLELYAVEQELSQQERLILLSKLIKRIKGSGIVYCTTTADCLLVANWLQSQEINAKPYYANVEDAIGESREELERQLLDNEVQALVASVALGMGFDKPDLHFVIHYQYPGSIITYYQQIGRAGRGIENAKIILLSGEEDAEIQHYFIETSFPKAEQVEKVIDYLSEQGEAKQYDLSRIVNVKKSALENLLLHLEVEHIVTKEKRYYRLLNAHKRPDYQRWHKVTQLRYMELAQMQSYLQQKGCLMKFLAKALDDPTLQHQNCGRCQNCTGKQIKSNPTPEEIDQATRFLIRGKNILIQPRKMWPTGGIPGGAKGKLEHVNADGLALCYLNSGGWGTNVKTGKAAGVFDDELVEASADLILAFWQHDLPQWVTAVPSRRAPELVPNFARRLAQKLKLPYHAVLQATRTHSPQANLHNSHQQVANLWNVFKVAGAVPLAPVLLVDDVADSGWTLTVVGQVLYAAGCPNVYPFVLAKVSR